MFISLILPLILLVSILGLRYDYLRNYSSAIVEGDSMLPSFYNNEEVLVAKNYQLDRFQVVVFDPPNLDTQKYLKRIIGLPGDHLQYRNGLLYINNQQVIDAYSDQTADFNLEEVFGVTQIPAGYYFVLGDNRENSLDSRIFGFVNRRAIFGIVQE